VEFVITTGVHTLKVSVHIIGFIDSLLTVYIEVSQNIPHPIIKGYRNVGNSRWPSGQLVRDPYLFKHVF